MLSLGDFYIRRNIIRVSDFGVRHLCQRKSKAISVGGKIA